MAQLSVREAAAELGVHPARITHWIASGRLRAEWIDGPQGRSRRIDADALSAVRRELHAAPDSSEIGYSPVGAEANTDPLSRARAVESYTAGLAATAIAPAVSRLVETIEQLTRENGDLREQIGTLKARLDSQTTPSGATGFDNVPLEGEPSGELKGLAHEQWDALRERLDRLSQPLPGTETAPAAAVPERAPENDRGPVARRRRRASPWQWLGAWIREKTA